LERVVEEMSNVFMNFSDDLLKTRRVNPEAIKIAMETFLHLSQRAARDPGEESEGTLGSDIAASKSSTTLLISPTQLEIRNHSNVIDGRHHQNSSPAGYKYQLDTGSSSITELGGAGPSVDYSLWGIPTQYSSNDGSSAIPYILAGRDSFASRLYFETIVLAVKALRGEASKEFLSSMFQYKLRYTNSKKILAVVSGVLNVMLHGTSQDPKHGNVGENVFQAIQDDDQAIKSAIVDTVVAEGGSESDYLSSWEVERYLREKWSWRIDSNTVRVQLHVSEKEATFDHTNSMVRGSPGGLAVFAPTMIPGFPSTDQIILNAQSLVEMLSNAAVTIGEGPRWHFAQVDHAVQNLLSENNL